MNLYFGECRHSTPIPSIGAARHSGPELPTFTTVLERLCFSTASAGSQHPRLLASLGNDGTHFNPPSTAANMTSAPATAAGKRAASFSPTACAQRDSTQAIRLYSSSSGASQPQHLVHFEYQGSTYDPSRLTTPPKAEPDADLELPASAVVVVRFHPKTSIPRGSSRRWRSCSLSPRRLHATHQKARPQNNSKKFSRLFQLNRTFTAFVACRIDCTRTTVRMDALLAR